MEGVEAADEEEEAVGIAAEVPQTIARMEIPSAPNVQSVARCTRQKIVLSWKRTKIIAWTIGKVFSNEARRSQQVIAWRFGHRE